MPVMKFSDAIQDAYLQTMRTHPEVFLIGVGITDAKAVFGTLNGLVKEFGQRRVVEGPLAEQMLTGLTFGAATMGLKPVLIHHRIDFLPLTFDQVSNHMAKWNFMFGGAQKISCVVRGVVGRGWGNGPQHTQSLHGFAASIPGVKVVVPANSLDAKGLMTAAILDEEPVIFIDHRSLHNESGEVPSGHFSLPIGRAHVVCEGSDITIAALGPMVGEAIIAAEALKSQGKSVEVINLRTVRPLDFATVLESVQKTGHLLVTDSDWPQFGVAATLISHITQNGFEFLKAAPASVTWPNHPVPATYALESQYYPSAKDLVTTALRVLKHDGPALHIARASTPHSGTGTGPF